MYVNDLPCGLDSYLKMFANDAKVMIEVKNNEDCISLFGKIDNSKVGLIHGS